MMTLKVSFARLILQFNSPITRKSVGLPLKWQPLLWLWLMRSWINMAGQPTSKLGQLLDQLILHPLTNNHFLLFDQKHKNTSFQTFCKTKTKKKKKQSLTSDWEKAPYQDKYKDINISVREMYTKWATFLLFFIKDGKEIGWFWARGQILAVSLCISGADTHWHLFIYDRSQKKQISSAN